MSAPRLQALQKFLEQDPNDSFTRYAIAMEHVSMRDIASAIAGLKQLIALDPHYVPAYHQLGILLSQTGRKEESRAVFLQGIHTAKQSGDSHAQSEMQESLDELDEE